MSDAGLWDHEADVVVVGAGAAGMSAALAALNEGASVIVLERAAEPGGTTAKSGGQFWVPNNRLMREAGIEDPREPMLRYMARLAFPHLYDPTSPTLGLPDSHYDLICTFYDNAAGAIDALTEMGALFPKLDLVTPSYSVDLEDDKAPYGRSLVPEGKPKNRADGTGGEVMIKAMCKAAEARGATILVEHRVAAVVRNELGEVIGLEVYVGRRTVLVRARRGVVFCSGGFLHNKDLARQFLRGPVFGGC